MNLSRIVCAIDDADTSRAVLTHAVAIARWQNADLHVVRVVDTALEQETSVPATVASEQATTLVVHGGDPVPAIVDYGGQVGADAIVVGVALPAAGLARPGWIGEAIAREAPCPTLIIPFGLPHRRDDLPFRNVLCAVDFSRASVVAFQRALELTRRSGGTLTLLHVLDEFRPRSGSERFFQPDDRRLRIAEARARLRIAVSQPSLRWFHVGIHVTAGATDVHILAEARRLGADLIVMGLTPRAEANRALPGSMVGRVAAQANCPVLVHKASANSPTWERRYPMPSGHVDQSAGEASRVHVSFQPAGDA